MLGDWFCFSWLIYLYCIQRGTLVVWIIYIKLITVNGASPAVGLSYAARCIGYLIEVEANWPASLDMPACSVWSSVYKWSSLRPGSVWCSSLLDAIGPLPLCSWLTHFFNCCWRRCRLKYKLMIRLMLYTL